MTDLDDTDRALIALLRDDARLPVATLAVQLRLARGTVQARLARLQRDGVIVGYTVRLKPQAEPLRIRAQMLIAVDGNAAPEVLRQLRGHPNVATLHSTNGRWDLIAGIEADDLAAFDRALGSIRRIAGIGASETSLLLSTHKA